MTITEAYYRQLELKHYQFDDQQLKAVQQLARLQTQLAHYQGRKHTLINKCRRLFNLPRKPPLDRHTNNLKGCYIWGDVGRGKTWLMDMFFDTLETGSAINEHKIRLHFHHFMQVIHDQLRLIGEQKNPLQHIARAFAQRYHLLCLDEFHVSDITDAMLLYGLLDTLLEEGVILIATSNQAPDELYKNGLQRERFLPAIELIKQHTQTLKLNGTQDHRLRLLEKADTWHLHSTHSQAFLESRFLQLANSPAQRQHKILINYRQIETVLYSNDIIWFDFQVICGDQRGSADYIEIARQFHTVLISHIPIMTDSHNDRAKRFITMIDEFYDRNVNLLSSAATLPEALYTGKQLSFEFKRTVSRLQEMRSQTYMQRPHKVS